MIWEMTRAMGIVSWGLLGDAPKRCEDFFHWWHPPKAFVSSASVVLNLIIGVSFDWEKVKEMNEIKQEIKILSVNVLLFACPSHSFHVVI